MKTLKSFILLILCFAYSHGFSQEISGTSLKLYSNFGWSDLGPTLGNPIGGAVFEKNTIMDMGYFTPAVVFSSANGNKHEIEFSRLKINQTDELIAIDTSQFGMQVISGERNTNIFIALRYEFSLLFLKNRENLRLQPSLGFAARPYYSGSEFVPALSTAFRTKDSDLGLMVSVTPRVTYDLNDRWFLDLNTVFNLASFNVHTSRYDNPTLPANKKSVTSTEGHLFPTEYLIRFGVGVRL